jgi:hypothetical protein
LANRRFEDHQSANEFNDGQRVSTARKRLNLKFYAILPHASLYKSMGGKCLIISPILGSL